MAQLVEQLLPIPEVLGSSHWEKKLYIEHLFAVNCIEKTKIKKKRPGMAHLKKIIQKCKQLRIPRLSKGKVSFETQIQCDQIVRYWKALGNKYYWKLLQETNN